MNDVLSLFVNITRSERELLIKTAKQVSRVTRVDVVTTLDMILQMRKTHVESRDLSSFVKAGR